MSIKYVDMAEEKTKSVMECERSVITMTLLRLGYLVHSFGNCAMTLPTETGITDSVHNMQLLVYEQTFFFAPISRVIQAIDNHGSILRLINYELYKEPF